MTFKDQIKSDMVNIFLNENEFAEEIYYTPKDGAEKTINAIVNRQPLDPAAETGNRTIVGQIELEIANDATYGVATITRGGDKARVREIEGGAFKTYVVADIINSDSGSWKLLVRK